MPAGAVLIGFEIYIILCRSGNDAAWPLVLPAARAFPDRGPSDFEGSFFCNKNDPDRLCRTCEKKGCLTVSAILKIIYRIDVGFADSVKKQSNVRWTSVPDGPKWNGDVRDLKMKRGK